jgi:flagellar motor protein MotB
MLKKRFPCHKLKKTYSHGWILRLACLSIFFFPVLAGCYNECQFECPALSPGCCIIPKRCCCLAKDPRLINKLHRDGVQVERMGDKVLIILPSDAFFFQKSTRLNPAYYPALTNVIAFINCYEKIEIKVAAYTDSCGCTEENLGLTRNQATNLASYLWNHGLDARLIYPVGYGEACPIGTDCHNRRIEITLTHLPPGVYDD